MGGIGGEAPDLAEGVLEPGQHAVQRLRQVVQLVLGSPHGHALAQVLRGDPSRGQRDVADRLEGGPGDARPPHGREDETEGDQDEEGLPVTVERLLGPLEGEPDLDELDEPPALHHRHGEEPDALPGRELDRLERLVTAQGGELRRAGQGQRPPLE